MTTALPFQITDTDGASLFDIFAENSLRDSLKPAWDFLCKFLASKYPRHLAQQTLMKYSDEIFYLFLLLMEEYNLRNRAASMTETFYQLKRECSAPPSSFLFRHAKMISLLSVVLLPYLMVKLEKCHQNIKERLQINDTSLTKLDIYIFEWYPVLKSFSKWLRMINYVLYLLKYSRYPFPLLHVTNIELKYDLEPIVPTRMSSDDEELSSIKERLLKGLIRKPLDIVSYGFSKLTPVLFYSLSFLDTFYDQDSWTQNPLNVNVGKMVPPQMSKVKISFVFSLNVFGIDCLFNLYATVVDNNLWISRIGIVQSYFMLLLLIDNRIFRIFPYLFISADYVINSTTIFQEGVSDMSQTS